MFSQDPSGPAAAYFHQFFSGAVGVLELGRDAAGFNHSAVRTNAPATFTFPAMVLRLGAEVLDLAPSVGTQGSELDLDSAPGVKVWCLREALGPAPGDSELLSAFNADSQCPGVGRSRP